MTPINNNIPSTRFPSISRRETPHVLNHRVISYVLDASQYTLPRLAVRPSQGEHTVQEEVQLPYKPSIPRVFFVERAQKLQENA